MRLTVKGIERLKRPGRRPDGHGLYLKISPSGIKSWVFRFERGGRERWMGLGPLHVVSLKSARERARRAREQLLDGVDPIEARKAEKAANAEAMTFSECVKLYYATPGELAKPENPRPISLLVGELRNSADRFSTSICHRHGRGPPGSRTAHRCCSGRTIMDGATGDSQSPARSD